jgi:DNA-binding response OmpR family regulator
VSLILHVDSDYDSRAILRSALSVDGYRVLEAEDADAAARQLADHDVKLIIGEYFVYSPEGDVFLPLLRERCPASDARVIVVSTRAFDEAQRDALRRGVDAYLTKPCDIRVIRETVRRVIGAPAER